MSPYPLHQQSYLTAQSFSLIGEEFPMAGVEFFSSEDWKFGFDGRPMVRLTVRLQALADRLAAPTAAYWANGVGPARALLGRLSSGVCFVLEELEFEIEQFGAKGATLYLDPRDVADRDIHSLLDEVLGTLGLSQGDIVAAADGQR